MDFFAKRKDDIDDDPSDFTQAALQVLDASLRCPICKEFYKNPVITPCFHSFCSSCVRLSLEAESTEKRTCPICATKVPSEKELRANSALEDVVDRYKESRSLLLELSKPPPPPLPSPRKKRKPTPSSTIVGSKEGGAAGSSSEGSSSRANGAKKGDAIEVLDGDEEEEDEVEVQSSSGNGKGKGKASARGKGLATCPICDQVVPEDTINAHIDSNCKKYLSAPSKPKSDSWNGLFGSSSSTTTKKVGVGVSGSSKNGATKSTSTSTSTPKEPSIVPPPVVVRLSRPNYNLLSEKQLRSKLEEFALPTTGNKVVLEARHRQWILLFNSNLDSSHPSKESELRSELRKWDAEKERELKAKKKRAEKDPISDQTYQKVHESEFASLERQVRERMAAAAAAGSSKKKRKVVAAEDEEEEEGGKKEDGRS